jgi:hypothetical protein
LKPVPPEPTDPFRNAVLSPRYGLFATLDVDGGELGFACDAGVDKGTELESVVNEESVATVSSAAV